MNKKEQELANALFSTILLNLTNMVTSVKNFQDQIVPYVGVQRVLNYSIDLEFMWEELRRTYINYASLMVLHGEKGVKNHIECNVPTVYTIEVQKWAISSIGSIVNDLMEIVNSGNNNELFTKTVDLIIEFNTKLRDIDRELSLQTVTKEDHSDTKG